MSRNFEDFDEKNIEIAKMLINDSEKITIDEKTNEKIIKSIRNGRKKTFLNRDIGQELIICKLF